MKRKLKISQKVKFLVTLQGESCDWASQATCNPNNLAYSKTPITERVGGLYVKKN